MPGRNFAKNGRISRNVDRIASSISSKSRRMAFQSGVIGGSSARIVAVRPFKVGMVNGLRTCTQFYGEERQKPLVSRTRCSVLYDAPQGRDPLEGDLVMDRGSAAHRHSASKTRVNALMALRSIRGTGRRGYSPLPIVTFSVPTPSTPHSILSPERQRRARLRSRHDDIAGVERDLLGQFGDYVRTLQIHSVRPPSASRQLPNYRRLLVDR